MYMHCVCVCVHWSICVLVFTVAAAAVVIIDVLIIRNSSYRLQLNCQVEHRLNGYLHCNRDQLPICKRQINRNTFC